MNAAYDQDLTSSDLTSSDLTSLVGITDPPAELVKPDLSITRLRKAAELNKIANNSTRSYVNDCLAANIQLGDIVDQVRKQLAKSGLWLVSTTGKYKSQEFHLCAFVEG